MIKEIILQQKIERDFLSSEEYVPREKLSIAQKFLDTDLNNYWTQKSRKVYFLLFTFERKKFCLSKF